MSVDPINYQMDEKSFIVATTAFFCIWLGRRHEKSNRGCFVNPYLRYQNIDSKYNDINQLYCEIKFCPKQ